MTITRKKMLRPLEHDTRENRETRSVRFSPSETEAIQRAANRYTNGDFSEWVRQASLRFVPEKTDLEEVH